MRGFIAALAKQARSQGWDVAQLEPPHRASRYFRQGGILHSVHPDAFGVLCGDGKRWPFFLEWERRAVRPSTMAARLAPYLRYYASQRPTDDHGVRPDVLVVFEDELAAHHFLRVARKEMDRARVGLPLRVSDRALIEREDRSRVTGALPLEAPRLAPSGKAGSVSRPTRPSLSARHSRREPPAEPSCRHGSPTRQMPEPDRPAGPRQFADAAPGRP